MVEQFILEAIRSSFSIPTDSELAIDTLTDSNFVVVETTSTGERKYRHGRYGPGWVQSADAVDLGDFNVLHAYDKLKRLVEEAQTRADEDGEALVLDPREHPDLFKPDYQGMSLFGWAHEPAMKALHALDDELKADGRTLQLMSKGESGPQFQVWLAPHRPRTPWG